MKQITPKEGLPELKYQAPEVKEKRCGTCYFERPTLLGCGKCLLMEKLFKKKGIENGNYTVDLNYGICDRWQKKYKFKIEK